MLIVTVKLVVKKEKKVDFLEIFNKLQPTVKREIGCIDYTLTRDLYRENHFFLFEQWKSKVDLELHLKSAHMKEFFIKTEEFFEKPLEIKQYSASEEPFAQ